MPYLVVVVDVEVELGLEGGVLEQLAEDVGDEGGDGGDEGLLEREPPRHRAEPHLADDRPKRLVRGDGEQPVGEVDAGRRERALDELEGEGGKEEEGGHGHGARDARRAALEEEEAEAEHRRQRDLRRVLAARRVARGCSSEQPEARLVAESRSR